jgi:hypothetical protein
MKALLEFVWRGVNISNFIDTDLIINDYNDTDTFWGEFALYGKEYQYQIFWHCQSIAIFNKGGIERIDLVDNFQLRFSKNYK